jgi:hypothetical protein
MALFTRPKTPPAPPIQTAALALLIHALTQELAIKLKRFEVGRARLDDPINRALALQLQASLETSIFMLDRLDEREGKP